MVHRRGERPAWLPAHLVWVPLLVVGLWQATGLDFDKEDVGFGQDRIRVSAPGTEGWFGTTEALVGVVLVVLGAIAFFASVWRPDWQRALVVSRYPMLAVASWLLLLAAVLSRWTTEGWIWSGSGGGFSVRFLAATRTGLLNNLTFWSCLMIGIALQLLAFGPRPQAARHSSGDAGAASSRPRIVLAAPRPAASTNDDLGAPRPRVVRRPQATARSSAGRSIRSGGARPPTPQSPAPSGTPAQAASVARRRQSMEATRSKAATPRRNQANGVEAQTASRLGRRRADGGMAPS